MPAAAVYNIADSDNPLEKALQEIGDLSKIDLAGAKVLVWIRISARKKGSILLPDSAIKEDIWQGVVGYVLKKGPLAFKDDEANKFGGFNPEIGRWVTFRPGDARRIQINGVDCRIVEDTLIDMTINDPEIITHRQ